MKMDWWRACWRSKSASGKGNETSQSQASSGSNYNKAEGRVTLWRETQGRASMATAWHTELSGRSSHPPERGKKNKKDKVARLETLSLASSLENDVMLLTEKMFAAFY